MLRAAPRSPTGLSRQNQKPLHSRVLARTNCLKLSSSFIPVIVPTAVESPRQSTAEVPLKQKQSRGRRAPKQKPEEQTPGNPDRRISGKSPPHPALDPFGV